MKVLNLEKFATSEKRQLVIAGVSHAVEDMSVENFIETTRKAEALAKETSLVVQVEATIEMIVRSVPTVTPAELGKLNLSQLQAIVAFVRGDDVEGSEEAPAEGGEKK